MYIHRYVEKYNLLCWFGLFAIGILGPLQFYMRITGLKLTGPVIFSFVRSFEVVIAYFVQITVFDTGPDFASISGAICLVVACTGVSLERKLLETVQHPRLRHIL